MILFVKFRPPPSKVLPVLIVDHKKSMPDADRRAERYVRFLVVRGMIQEGFRGETLYRGGYDAPPHKFRVSRLFEPAAHEGIDLVALGFSPPAVTECLQTYTRRTKDRGRGQRCLLKTSG